MYLNEEKSLIMKLWEYKINCVYQTATVELHQESTVHKHSETRRVIIDPVETIRNATEKQMYYVFFPQLYATNSVKLTFL